MRFILAFILSFSVLGADYTLQVSGAERPSPTITLRGHGRGVAVSKRHVLTARHVVQNITDTAFRTPEVMIDGAWVAGKIVGDDEENDLALIEMPEGTKLKPIDILSIPDLYTEGSPGIEDSHVKRRSKIKYMIMAIEEVTGLATPYDVGGLSGSPMHDGDNLIGIVSAAKREGDGIVVKVIGPEPIKQLLANHIKSESKD